MGVTKITNLIDNPMKSPTPTAPIIIRETQQERFDLKEFKTTHHVFRTTDLFEGQLKELFEISNPHLIYQQDFKKRQTEYVNKRLAMGSLGNWIFFPWSGELTHILDETEYSQLRTNRNKNLINDQEQKILSKFPVAITGMSVGSHIASALAYSSIAGSLKLADFDILSTTNLNRVKARITDVYKPKIDIIAEQLYGVNPYITLQLYPQGVREDNLEDFFTKGFRPRLIVELIDDFKMKIRLRIEARRRQVPLLMFTNLGDSILVDIERYDLTPNLELFNGLVGPAIEEILKNPITEDLKKELAVKLVGANHVPTRALETLQEINKTLVGRPQLYSTVTAMSGVAAFIIKKIALGENVQSGRKFVPLDTFLPQGK